MTDIEGFLTIYGHSDNLLNNNVNYWLLSWSQKLSETKRKRCVYMSGSRTGFSKYSVSSSRKAFHYSIFTVLICVEMAKNVAIFAVSSSFFGRARLFYVNFILARDLKSLPQASGHEFENTLCLALEYVFHCYEFLGNALDFYHAIVVYTLIKVHSVSAAVRNTSSYNNFNTNTFRA